MNTPICNAKKLSGYAANGAHIGDVILLADARQLERDRARLLEYVKNDVNWYDMPAAKTLLASLEIKEPQ